jgi:hypothetical protein
VESFAGERQRVREKRIGEGRKVAMQIERSKALISCP